MELAGEKIDKRHVAATIDFAVNHIPRADKATLEQYLELINATGNFGAISSRQLLGKMQLLIKYVPNTCRYSLLMLAELLEIWPSADRDRHILSEEFH